jgi:hypothetical protein
MQLEEDVNYLSALCSTVHRCVICGKAFARSEELEEHSMTVHNSEESMLLRKAGEEEKARKRSRGPYRKSHAA